MFLIPYHRLVLRSDRLPGDVVALLALNTGTMRWFRRPAATQPFWGSVNAPFFRLGLNEAGTNTYAPWIRGDVTAAEAGSRVSLVMTLHPVAVFMVTAFWGAPFLFANANPALLVALFALFHTVMCVVGFWPTARRAETALRKVTE